MVGGLNRRGDRWDEKWIDFRTCKEWMLVVFKDRLDRGW